MVVTQLATNRYWEDKTMGIREGLDMMKGIGLKVMAIDAIKTPMDMGKKAAKKVKGAVTETADDVMLMGKTIKDAKDEKIERMRLGKEDSDE
jgi:hypothetical protein